MTHSVQESHTSAQVIPLLSVGICTESEFETGHRSSIGPVDALLALVTSGVKGTSSPFVSLRQHSSYSQTIPSSVQCVTAADTRRFWKIQP